MAAIDLYKLPALIGRSFVGSNGRFASLLPFSLSSSDDNNVTKKGSVQPRKTKGVVFDTAVALSTLSSIVEAKFRLQKAYW